jgi:hypothetical protein
LRVRDSDFEARRQDLESVIMSNNSQEDLIKGKYAEIEALKRVS